MACLCVELRQYDSDNYRQKSDILNTYLFLPDGFQERIPCEITQASYKLLLAQEYRTGLTISDRI